MGLKSNLRVSTIIKTFGMWAVTVYGVECLVRYYPIKKSRLNENWVEHMTEKRWMTQQDLSDLESALNYAKAHFKK